MKFELAPRMRAIKPSPTAIISDKVRKLVNQGIDVINLGEGELDFPTPNHIAAAGIQAIRHGETKYTAVSGTPQLKMAIAKKLREKNGQSYQHDEIIAGNGAKQLIFNAILATVSKDDEVIIPAPYWVSYSDIVEIAEGIPKIILTDEKKQWKLTSEVLEAAINNKTKWVILNSPNNPTGSLYNYDELKLLTDVLLDYPQVMIMADDIYEYHTYGKKFYNLLQVEPRLKERTLIINGVSKGYSMTGWRLGYAAGPKWLISALNTLQSQSTSNPSSISQAAAATALNSSHDFFKDWETQLLSRQKIVTKALNDLPQLTFNPPAGAFYIYVNCKQLIGMKTPQGKIIKSDLDLATYLLEKAHVGLVHGTAFGTPGYLRIAYAVDNERLQTACNRLVNAVQQLTTV